MRVREGADTTRCPPLRKPGYCKATIKAMRVMLINANIASTARVERSGSEARRLRLGICALLEETLLSSA